MIRVNLLNSVTERQNSPVASVERKVSSPVSRLLLMSLAVFVLTAAVIGWDIISTQMAKSNAEARLEEQKRIAAELEAVMKEMKELEGKIAAIDARINAIKKLREEQSGPSAVLDALQERIAMVPGLYLESVEQKGDQLEIKGTSNDETAPTRFGQSLEFSNGLFSNLGIETTRKEEGGATQVSTSDAPNKNEQPKVVSFDFVIRCVYTPSKAGQNSGSSALASTTQPNQRTNVQPQAAQNKQQTSPQIAQN
jgi:Tfp pilus assembly protein PilN